MVGLGKIIIFLGFILIALGLLMVFASKVSWLGRLPGDILIKREHFTFYAPLTTSLLLSLLVSFLVMAFYKRTP